MTGIAQSCWMPALRPHFSRRDNSVFFLISRRATLTLAPGEVCLFDAIDGRTTIGQLEERYSGASDSLAAWHGLGVVEYDQRPDLPREPHLVVLEPHMDDAVLSVGAALLSRRGKMRVTLLTMAGRSNFTSYWYLDRPYFAVEEISSLRRAESALVARLLGASHQWMEEDEAPLRFFPSPNWSTEEFKAMRAPLSAFSTHPAPAGEVQQLAAKMKRRFEDLRPDALWIPAGLGRHVDHALTRDAALQALLDMGPRDRPSDLRLYEDVPYSARFPEASAQLQEGFTRAGGKLQEIVEPMEMSLSEKLRLISIYASQFKLSALERDVRSAASPSPGFQGYVEKMHLVHALPKHRVDGACLTCDPGFDTFREGLSEWLTRVGDSTEVTVVSRAAFGRFGHFCHFLKRALPGANIRMLLASANRWETSADAFPGIMVQSVGDGPVAWAGALVQEAPRRCPVLVATAGMASWQEGVIRAMFAGRDAMFADEPSTITVAFESMFLSDVSE